MWFQSPETLKIQESLRYFRLFHNGVTVSKFAKYYDKMMLKLSLYCKPGIGLNVMEHSVGGALDILFS